jgi:hypothetical protein
VYALLTKGRNRVKIHTGGNVVITNYDTCGQGFVGAPYRDTVDDPETLAQEYIDSYLADGWTRVE